jgi:Mg2+ and Co2+ transporter CorA
MVTHEYINRELATIEYILEKEEPGIQDLETYLKDLYGYRRRYTMYYNLLGEAKQQCQRRGQQNWRRSSTSDAAIAQAKDLEEDFTHLQSKMQLTGQRTEKNLNLLKSLVAISEGKHSVQENHRMAQITLVAAVFLPFSTVAAILGMQGTFAPGAEAFWVFWAVAIPLTLFIILTFVIYNSIERIIFKQFIKFFSRPWLRNTLPTVLDRSEEILPHWHTESKAGYTPQRDGISVSEILVV